MPFPGSGATCPPPRQLRRGDGKDPGASPNPQAVELRPSSARPWHPVAVCFWLCVSARLRVGGHRSETGASETEARLYDLICPSQSRVLGVLRYFPWHDKVRAGPIPIPCPSRPGELLFWQ
jgi:hypothetical protein